MKSYDIIVIGGGPGGYVAAISAAQSGLRVACIDKRKNLGGTCLNVGCIPSKRLLYSSELYKSIIDNANNHGVEVKSPKLNLSKMMIGKDQAIDKLTKGIEFLFKKNKIKHIVGSAFIKKDKIIDVNGDKFRAENIIIASGSYPAELKNIRFDEDMIVSSTGAINFTKIPKRLAVIGAGYIGLELGSVWKRLGSDVTVIEYTNSIVPSMDIDIANNFYNELKKQGINFLLSTEVTKAQIKGKKVNLDIKSKKGKKQTIIFDKALLAIGRLPMTDGLGLKEAGIKTTENGYIDVDHIYETSVKGIYAIGDVIEGPMLAHKASMEGQVVIEVITGKNGQVNYDAIPSVVYTNPEVAWVGKTQQELDSYNIEYNVGKFQFSSNSRSKVSGNTVGMIKVFSHKETDKILGAHIIGNHAGEMIGEFVVAIELGATAEDLALICHAHPTLSESIKEASSLASYGQSIHS
jgi:dihydrolipoamide dehydrogenase